MIERKNLINGKQVAATYGKTFVTKNPAHLSETVASYQMSDIADVSSAIAAARAAFAEWSAVPMPARGGYLRKAARILASRVGEVAREFTREEGKTLGEATGETNRAAEILEYFAGQARYPMAENYPPETPGNLLYTTREPLGVVGLITPWNFPIAIPAWKLAPALLYGNTVVIKPASSAPAPAYALVEALTEAGIPDGVINLVTGSGALLGTAITNDDNVAAISFTGSEEAGNEIYQHAALSRKKVQMELGGKNAVVILADADVDKAVEQSAFGAYWSAGQKCTATSRIIVAAPVHDQVVEKLVKLIGKLKVGDGLADGVQISPLIDRKAVAHVTELCEEGVAGGAKCLIGGKMLTKGDYSDGCYFAPSLYELDKPEGALWEEELFGPVAVVIRAQDAEEALELANNTRYGLVTSIFTQSLHWAHYFAQGLQTGIVQINRATVGADVHVPFGGIKASGSGGKEQGLAAREFYTKVKTVYVEWK
jgi:acyl-CoA reductase-like NAD-dependent aldehyde dehydrogenase